jgi:AraC-like DNA-binding protein
MKRIELTHKVKSDFEDYPHIFEPDQSPLSTWLTQTSSEVTSAIEYNCREIWQQNKAVKNDNVLYYFLDGNGVFNTTNTGKVKYKSRDILILPQGLQHSIIPIGQSHLIVVHFNSYIYSGINLMHIGGFPEIINNPIIPNLEHSFCELVRDHALEPFSYQHNMNLIVDKILIDICRFHSNKFTKTNMYKNHEKIHKIVPVLQWMDSHFSINTITCAQIAKLIHVSEVYLRKLFNQTIGLSPIDYLQKKRIEVACKYIKETNHSIDTILEKTGFQNKPFFYRVFKKWMSMTPKQYKNNKEI